MWLSYVGIELEKHTRELNKMPRCGIDTRSVGKDFTGRPFGWLKASDLSEMKQNQSKNRTNTIGWLVWGEKEEERKGLQKKSAFI